jgi:DHA1 family inner membrane transport protein
MRAAAAFRIWLIAALVCGSFGIGISEFVVMGLLPGIAEDLMPRLFAASPESALALAGGTVSAYALGVVVGMFVAP